jgi:DNA invertase Pin-like site-specific DNA recombinase
MNTEQQVKFMADIQAIFMKMYRLEMSARIKRGIEAKKKKTLFVKNSKV